MSPAAERPPDPLVSAVARELRGKRALVVTNRDDGELGDRLLQTMQLGSVDVVRSDPRRIEAATASVIARRFDIVLAASGFMDHSTDGVMKTVSACAKARVPYVRVAKPRPAACVRAIARAFGIDETASSSAIE